jgi:thioredoxin-dependent peroxiredoxin
MSEIEDARRGTRVRRGDLAPEFALPGTDGTPDGHRTYRLSELRSQPIVLVFYPGDDTPVCTEQLTTYTQDIGRFRQLDAQVLAISPQSVDSHDRFATKVGGFAFPLLADQDKSVGDAYGVVGPLGFYRRSVFVIDPYGVIAWLHRSVGGASFQPTEDLLTAVERIRPT